MTTLAPRARISHMCLMGTLVFLPGLHPLHSTSTHTPLGVQRVVERWGWAVDCGTGGAGHHGLVGEF